MNKPPAFQFYAQDFLTGVMYLTNEEIGIYIKMLCKQWTDERIPKKRLGLLVGYEWDVLSDELKEKFTDKGNYIINERLEIERQKKLNFIEKQKLNGKLGGRPKKSSKKINPNKTQTITQKNPLEEEYEIEEEYENLKIKKVEKQKLIEKHGLKGYNWMIDKLSNYKLSTGKEYKSDYGAINSWVSKEWKKENTTNKTQKKDAATILQERYNLNT